MIDLTQNKGQMINVKLTQNGQIKSKCCTVYVVNKNKKPLKEIWAFYLTDTFSYTLVPNGDLNNPETIWIVKERKCWNMKG